jgi:hypothetical protein
MTANNPPSGWLNNSVPVLHVKENSPEQTLQRWDLQDPEESVSQVLALHGHHEQSVVVAGAMGERRADSAKVYQPRQLLLLVKRIPRALLGVEVDALCLAIHAQHVRRIWPLHPSNVEWSGVFSRVSQIGPHAMQASSAPRCRSAVQNRSQLPENFTWATSGRPTRVPGADSISFGAPPDSG